MDTRHVQTEPGSDRPRRDHRHRWPCPAGLIVTSNNGIRAEINAIRAEIQAVRTEFRADREAFEKHITRLTQEQSKLTGIVEQMRTASRRE